MSNEYSPSNSENPHDSERDKACAEFSAECADLSSSISMASTQPEMSEAFRDNISYIKPFIEDKVDLSYPKAPSPREAAILLQPETARMVATLFQHLEAEGYPKWLIDGAVTITSTVRSKEYTNHIYDQYIAEAKAAGDTATANRWKRIKARLASGAQLSHTTGRKVDIVVSQRRLNSLSEFWNPNGIFASVENFFKSGKASGFNADFHAGHFDIYPTTPNPRDIPFETDADINNAIAARNNTSQRRASGNYVAEASQGVPVVADSVEPEGAGPADKVSLFAGQVEPKGSSIVEGKDLHRSVIVDSRVVQTRLNLRDIDNPNKVLQKAKANDVFECSQPPAVKTGKELGLADEDLADLKFVCLKSSKGKVWAWLDAFKQEEGPTAVA